MQQVVQEFRTGRVDVLDVPVPLVGRGCMLICSRASLVSAGTERMLVDFGRANVLEKIRQQPQKARQVLDKVSTDGVAATLEAVQRKLDEPVAMGYSNVGDVVAVGAGVEGFAVGDRVVSNGPHAEFVSVPASLCARVPAGVTDEQAAFTILGAIALQGIRLIAPTLGESVAVSGLGLIGLLAVQLLRANGCRVIGIDPDPGRRQIARDLGAVVVDLDGADEVVARCRELTQSIGVDAVLICAATRSAEPVATAAQLCRKRGRIVLVGTADLKLNRDDFYRKELSFQVSCSYGPGRYDPSYEEQGHDYPLPFVRWTEQRNFEATLQMMAEGRVQVGGLVSHRFPIARAPEAYDLVVARGVLGILFEYSASTAPLARQVPLAAPTSRATRAVIGAIGAGNYAGGVLLPAFARTEARLKTIVSSRGLTGTYHGRRLGFEQSTTDIDSVLADPEIDTVIVATRHDSHASLALAALRAGKHVFVEKPLALTKAEIDDVEQCARAPGAPLLMVGFNRRFAPHAVEMRRLLSARTGPIAAVYTVNAGELPAEHWAQGEQGGGRILGEACHFIDLLCFMVGTRARRVRAVSSVADEGARAADVATLTLDFADGSIGTVHYFANGSKRFPKERLEVFRGGAVLQLDNFTRLRGFGWPGIGTRKSWRQDKGQQQCVAAFVRAVQAGTPSPVLLDELVETSRLSIEAASQIDGLGTH